MKKCPFCAEEIQSEALKCKHCGEWLPKPTSNPVTEALVESPVPSPASASAEADVVSPERAPNVTTFAQITRLFWAWLIATWILVSQQFKVLLRPDVPSSLFWMVVFLTAFNSLITIAFLVRLRYPGVSFPIWGVAWRAVAATFFGILFKVLFEFLLSIDHTQVEFSFGNALIWEFVSLGATLLSVWLLFSHNRRRQLESMFAALRGY